MTERRDIRVHSRDEAVELVRAAVAERATLAVEGAGSKRGWGGAMGASWTARLDDIVGIVCYEPEELVLTVRPGTPIAEIDTLLAEQQQMLAFEPPDFGPLWGRAAARATVGGTVACNASGPRRLRGGAARDHLLGAELVNGCGEVVRTGGRVVKNVTGYDLCKLLAGSFGTLGILTELALKLVPRPRASASLALRGLDAAAATQVMAELMAGSSGPSALAYLPASVCAPILRHEHGDAQLLARFEGSCDGVAERVASVQRQWGGDVLAHEESSAAWAAIRDVTPFRGSGELWRLAIAPTSMAVVASVLREDNACRWFADWGGSLVWVCMDPGNGATDARALAAQLGGRATLFRGAPGASAAIWPPLQPAVAALNARIKASFDPLGVLNPRRLGW